MGDFSACREVSTSKNCYAGRKAFAFRACGNGLFSTLKVIHHICNCPFDNDFVIIRKHDGDATSASIPQKMDERWVYRDRFSGLRFEETQF